MIAHGGLDRLEALFAEREPEVRAFLPEEGRFDRLRREAAALDPEPRLPLFGLPVGVKDIIRVDGFPTRAGSRLPPEALAGTEAACVTALRKAGALILGKTVSAEFAYFAPGPTRNPWNPEHTPGGSSSGSAAAVGAGLCPLALGTQTIGSVIRPAAFCGVVGFKPSAGRIPKDGVFPLAPSYDEVGFFTPDVATAALAAPVLCTGWVAGKPERKPRLGVPEGPYLDRADPEGLAHFHSVCGRLAAAGYEIETVPVLRDFDEVLARHFRVFAGEAARVHQTWFDRFGGLYEPRTADLIRRGWTITEAELEEDRAGRERLLEELTAPMDRRGFDLWISPPARGAAPRGLDSTGDPVMNVPWTQAGMPVICLPAGWNEAGLPLGLQAAGVLGSDEELLAWAADLENTLRT